MKILTAWLIASAMGMLLWHPFGTGGEKRR